MMGWGELGLIEQADLTTIICLRYVESNGESGKFSIFPITNYDVGCLFRERYVCVYWGCVRLVTGRIGACFILGRRSSDEYTILKDDLDS